MDLKYMCPWPRFGNTEPSFYTFWNSGNLKTVKGKKFTVTRHKVSDKHYDFIIDNICVTQLAGKNSNFLEVLADGIEPDEEDSHYWLFTGALRSLKNAKKYLESNTVFSTELQQIKEIV